MIKDAWAYLDTIPLEHVAVVILALLIIAVVLTAIEIRQSPVSSDWDLIRDADGEILGVVDMGRRREQKRAKGIDGETYRAPRRRG